MFDFPAAARAAGDMRRMVDAERISGQPASPACPAAASGAPAWRSLSQQGLKSCARHQLGPTAPSESFYYCSLCIAACSYFLVDTSCGWVGEFNAGTLLLSARGNVASACWVTVIVLKLSRSGVSRFGHFYIETIRGASFGP